MDSNGSGEVDLGGAEKKGKHAVDTIPEGTEWVLGRVYAKWCGHCVHMKEDWDKLKTSVGDEKGGKVAVVDIEDIVMNSELPKLNKKYFKHHSGIQSAGFPTIFIYKTDNADNTLDYYKGERTYGAMKHWVESKLSTAPIPPSTHKHKRKMGGGLRGNGGSRKKKSLRRKKNKTRRCGRN